MTLEEAATAPPDGGGGAGEETPPEEAAADVATVVRTMRFEITWPGWRKEDLHALWEELWKAQDDLRRAANKAASALFQVKLGTVPWPELEAKRGKDKGKTRKAPLRTLCYQILSGAWKPFGEDPTYKPTTQRPVSSHTLLDLSGVLYTRIHTDWLKICMGERSLPTFRSISIGSPYTKVDPEQGLITFALWAGSEGKVTVRPRKLNPRQWRDLRRALKYGNCRLTWDRPPGRKGRWMLSLSITLPKRERAITPMVAGIRLGMYETCTIAYGDKSTGKVSKQLDSVHLPASTRRTVARIAKEREERGRWNRKDHGQRSGRGRRRKLRAVEDLGDIVSRTTDTAIRQVAAAVVATALKRGASAVALPDLAHWSVSSELDKTEPLPEEPRAERRKRYFAWHQGALRQRISEAAEREGLKVLTAPAGGMAHTCAECGKIDKDQRQGRRWICSCGYRTSVEENSARVLASRALAL